VALVQKVACRGKQATASAGPRRSRHRSTLHARYAAAYRLLIREIVIWLTALAQPRQNLPLLILRQLRRGAPSNSAAKLPSKMRPPIARSKLPDLVAQSHLGPHQTAVATKISGACLASRQARCLRCCGSATTGARLLKLDYVIVQHRDQRRRAFIDQLRRNTSATSRYRPRHRCRLTHHLSIRRG
jgi:hypothetical protein